MEEDKAIYSANDEKVAYVPPPSKPGQGGGRPSIHAVVDGKINGEVLAASPEMYEALVMLVEGTPEERRRGVKAGAAALRKARGKRGGALAGARWRGSRREA